MERLQVNEVLRDLRERTRSKAGSGGAETGDVHPPSRDELLRHRWDALEASWTTIIKDPAQRKAVYSAYSETVPSHPSVIFYESMSGAKIMDSPYAICDEILSRPDVYGADRLHVWSVGSDERIPPRFEGRHDVVFVRRHTREYMYLLTRAAYIIGNSVLPEYFVRKPDQAYLNTWHGIGYKTLGRTADNPLGASLSVTNMLQATHVTSPCSFMTETLLTGFSMRHTYTGKLAEVGYPRIDTTLNATDAEKERLRKHLRLDPRKRTIVYAPTWRDGAGRDNFDFERLDTDLEALANLDVNAIFLPHHIMTRNRDFSTVKGLVVPPSDTNTNLLLSLCDLLITDYSSIFFDFLPLGRPIVHYVYDHEKYSAARGLTLSLDELPGTIALTVADLLEGITDGLSAGWEPSPAYRAAVSRFSPFDDGHSSSRVIRWFFGGDDSSVRLVQGIGARRRVVFWGGRMEGEAENAEFLSRVRREVQRDVSDVTVLVARSVSSDDTVVAALRDLGPSISVVCRNNYTFGMTEEEDHARGQASKSEGRAARRLYDRIYEREYRRIFGDTQFDDVVLHPNLSHFWKKLAGYASA